MIDLGQAGEQKELGASGPIPPKSIVKVRMELRKPKNQDSQDPSVNVFKTGLKGLDCEFTVVGGQFDGKQIWENWFLPPSMQTVTLTKGQEGVCNGSFAKARAVIEAARALNPEDPAANRSISSWFDLHGLEFPVRVGIDKPKPGDKYVNNVISKVITMTDEHYKAVMGGVDHITDEPIPEIPAAPPGSGNGSSAPPSGWGGAGSGGVQQPSPPVGNEPPNPADSPSMNIPAWAK